MQGEFAHPSLQKLVRSNLSLDVLSLSSLLLEHPRLYFMDSVSKGVSTTIVAPAESYACAYQVNGSLVSDKYRIERLNGPTPPFPFAIQGHAFELYRSWDELPDALRSANRWQSVSFSAYLQQRDYLLRHGLPKRERLFKNLPKLDLPAGWFWNRKNPLLD